MSIGSELLALKNVDGLVVVEDAYAWAEAHPRSALHGALEWDDAIAGREHRLSQIRKLINIHVRYEDGGPRLISLSVDRGRPGGGYRDLSDIIDNRDRTLFEIALQDCLNELDRLQRKYQRLLALQPVWAAVASVRQRARRRQGRGRGGGTGVERRQQT